ncbi:uncharacterized protein LOC129589587 isoform X2 [Paramacrobiotus metropolitanus]|uniref:uncharacterized protein LOC129589587 isoform X2 n=1 Tax=Paramacrobiotus metropolitanus TaxID=2943436 RepID=UPI00244578F0|nr:uncharacterized protein LOC129589587 isoform X2 [Paramacrobiotus metropolitanus]XP_055340363.1 uncharacterized protein LOC129589587 isoform X2 [Paramacrobiotus metropolitanus]XP_055340364.1 uncharacterized protein LOC129589587 isoform X2 [Paramacrobiotus metropolitanus]
MSARRNILRNIRSATIFWYCFFRVGKYFNHLLSSKTIRQCLLLPRHRRHVVDVLNKYTSRGADSKMAYIIGNTITADVRILYLTGKWKERLNTLSLILKKLCVKLDWLIIANNSTLLFNEFLEFPEPFPMMCMHNFETVTANYMPAIAYTNYAPICRHIVLKSCCFNSKSSICFTTMLLVNEGNSTWFAPKGRSRLRCCREPFCIKIPYWRYSFSEPASSTFAEGFQFALAKFCPELEESTIKALLHWLKSVKGAKVREPKAGIWPFIQLSYTLWNEEMPMCLKDVLRHVSKKCSAKSLILQTLALLMPCKTERRCKDETASKDDTSDNHTTDAET